jgi:hypothetical protein
MARPKLSLTEKRVVRETIAFTLDERTQIAEKMEACGYFTVAEYIRSCTLRNNPPAKVFAAPMDEQLYTDIKALIEKITGAISEFDTKKELINARKEVSKLALGLETALYVASIEHDGAQI